MRALRLALAGAALAGAVAVPATPATAAQMCRIVIDPMWVRVPGTDIWVSVPRVYCVSP